MYSGAINDRCHCEESSVMSSQGVTGRYNFYSEPYPFGYFEWLGYNIRTLDSSDYSTVLDGNPYNGSPIPTVWNSHVKVDGSGDNFYQIDEIRGYNTAFSLAPSEPTEYWKYDNALFDGLYGRLSLDISQAPIESTDSLKYSYNGTVYAYPENCIESHYYSAIRRYGYYGLKYFNSVDMFPPLATGGNSGVISYSSPNFPSGIVFYSWEDTSFRQSGKIPFTMNYYDSAHGFISGRPNITCQLDSTTGIGSAALWGFSCGEPLIIQQPLNARTKIGGKAKFKCLALDYHGIPYSKYQEGHTELNDIASAYQFEPTDLSYQWYRVSNNSRNNSTYAGGVKIPLISVNGVSNGANTNELTVMDIDIVAPIGQLEFFNFGSGYSVIPNATINGGEITPGSLSFTIDAEGRIDSYSIDDAGLYEWLMPTGEYADMQPVITFDASPSGSQYTASGVLWPGVGYNKNALEHQSYFTRGIRTGIDELFSYYCEVSGSLARMKTRAANLSIDRTLTVPLTFINQSYYPVSKIELYFTGNSHFYKLETSTGFERYAGYIADCAARPDTYYEQFYYDELADSLIITGSGYFFAAYGLIGKEGDCWRGENSSLKPRHTQATKSYEYVLDSGRIDYGRYVLLTGELNQIDGDLLYGLRALPVCENWQLTHSGVAVETIVSYVNPSGSFKRKYRPQSCPGFMGMNFDSSSDSWHDGVCSHRNYFGYNYPSDVYGYSSQLNALGCVGGFSSGAQIYCPAYDPMDQCSVAEVTEQQLWELFTPQMIAGTGCGYRDDSLKRRHLFYLEEHTPIAYGEDNTCSNLNYQAGNLYLKDAGIQYNFLNYPSDARVTWTGLSGPFAYKWKHDVHGRDKNDNGIPNNFLNIFDYTSPMSMIDHAALYGLNSGYSNTYLTKPCPTYKYGYKTGIDAGGVPGQREEGNYFTPLLEIDSGPFRTLKWISMGGEIPLPSGDILDGYDQVAATVSYTEVIYNCSGTLYSQASGIASFAGNGDGSLSHYSMEGRPGCGVDCYFPYTIFSGDVSGECNFSEGQTFPDISWTLKMKEIACSSAGSGTYSDFTFSGPNSKPCNATFDALEIGWCSLAPGGADPCAGIPPGDPALLSTPASGLYNYSWEFNRANSNISCYRAFAIEDITSDCFSTGCLSTIPIGSYFRDEIKNIIFSGKESRLVESSALDTSTEWYYDIDGSVAGYVGYYINSTATEVYFPVTSTLNKLGAPTSDGCFGVVHLNSGISDGFQWQQKTSDCSISLVTGRSYKIHQLDWAAMPLCDVFLQYISFTITGSSSLDSFYDQTLKTQENPYEQNIGLPIYPYNLTGANSFAYYNGY